MTGTARRSLVANVLVLAVAVLGLLLNFLPSTHIGPHDLAASAATTFENSYDTAHQHASARPEQEVARAGESTNARHSAGTPSLAPSLDALAGVAAEDVGGGVVRHYTTDAAAQSISKTGSIEPGLGSGKTWLTPDRYASGAKARAKLALNKTPDGYYEIPMCRVQCASGPSTVEPFYGQPGGGTEITTGFPIDISDLPFIRFGG